MDNSTTSTMTEDDEQFLRAFDDCSMSGACWTHTAHIRMAWLQMERASSLDEALERIRIGIKRFNSSKNSIGYHETITVAFARIIWHRRQLTREIKDWQEFLVRYNDLVSKQSPILNLYYSPELLSSDQAKIKFVEPDRKPLPAIGTVRMATEADAAKLLAIYAPYVERTVISFEYSVPSENEFRKRISDVLSLAPWLVFEIDGVPCGYAYGTKHKERDAYRWSCDVSVYIAEGHHRKGIGQILYTELLARVKEQGFYNAFAGITLPNANSVGLHESMGFEYIGTYKSVGYKMNKWHDVGWWQKKLNAHDSEPLPVRSPGELGRL